MKRIPSSYQLGPHTIEVHIVSEEEMRAACKRADLPMRNGEEPPAGLTVYEENKIYVLKVTRKFRKGLQMHAFWHEYFHMLFWHLGRERLARDETLVDTAGALQLQAFQTAEF
jgi:hypothetical protein